MWVWDDVGVNKKHHMIRFRAEALNYENGLDSAINCGSSIESTFSLAHESSGDNIGINQSMSKAAACGV
jgi:hypothetical protein